jgi:homoserine kinase
LAEALQESYARRMKTVRVFAPATVANVGSAFDVLGFALEAPGDTVEASLSSTPGIRIRIPLVFPRRLYWITSARTTTRLVASVWSSQLKRDSPSEAVSVPVQQAP